ncbi:MAG: hypothetical protein KDC57_15770 [Saprospiraceae bacterium]|nr:hypothetical protein [Saprospiraceae bacterium]
MITLNPKPSDDMTIDLENIIDNSNIVRLEGTNLTHVEKIFYLNGKYYIYNTDSETRYLSVCIYSENGLFIKDLSSYDHIIGNKWYIKDFYVDDNNIELLDRLGKKIIKFDINGEYISTLKPLYSGSRFYKQSINSYIFYANAADLKNKQEIKHFFCLKENNIQYTFAPIMDIFTLQGLEMLPNFFPIQGNTISNRDILCCNLYNDTLYSINKDGINKKMLIHFPNKIKRDKILTELNNDFSRSKLDYVVHELSILLNSAEITRGLNYYYENDKFIVLSYRYKNSRRLSFFDKSGQIIKEFNFPYLKDEFHYIFFTKDNDNLGIVASSPNTLIEKISNAKLSTIFPEIQLGPELNPIIITIPFQYFIPSFYK